MLGVGVAALRPGGHRLYSPAGAGYHRVFWLERIRGDRVDRGGRPGRTQSFRAESRQSTGSVRSPNRPGLCSVIRPSARGRPGSWTPRTATARGAGRGGSLVVIKSGNRRVATADIDPVIGDAPTDPARQRRPSSSAGLYFVLGTDRRRETPHLRIWIQRHHHLGQSPVPDAGALSPVHATLISSQCIEHFRAGPSWQAATGRRRRLSRVLAAGTSRWVMVAGGL